MKKCSVSILLMFSFVLSFFTFTAHAEEKLFSLTDSLTVEYESYQKSFENDVTWNIEFPVVSGFENKNLEKDINQKIRSFFMAGPKNDETVLSLNGSANAILAGSVGIFYADALYKSSEDTVNYWRDSIAVDLISGRVYTLDDLFLPNYKSILSEMLVSLDNDFDSFVVYRFAPYGVQFYTDNISDKYLYLSFTKMNSIIDTNSLCYRAITDSKVKMEIVSLPFKDVPISHWAYPYIYEVYLNRIMTGTDAGFLPDSSMTAAEFCVAVSRSLNLKNDAKILYDAVPQNKWYSGELNKVYEIGLLTGLQKDFQYENPISREDAMVILANVLQSQNPDTYLEVSTESVLNPFSDAKLIEKDKRKAAAICINSELIGGSNGKLMPKSQFSRAQVAKILYLLVK